MPDEEIELRELKEKAKSLAVPSGLGFLVIISAQYFLQTPTFQQALAKAKYAQELLFAVRISAIFFLAAMFFTWGFLVYLGIEYLKQQVNEDDSS